MNHNSLLLLLTLLLSSFTVTVNADASELQTYIIHVKHPPEGHNLDLLPEAMEPWYYSLLAQSGIKNPAPGTTLPRIVHSYSHALTGFTARLTSAELDTISKADWFVIAYPSRSYQLHTTRTPQFLGLNSPDGLWKLTNYGEGIIIGVVDTGIAYTHPSFTDDTMPPPPKKWKGKCEPPVVCNNKLIGARSFISGQLPTDSDGHGTHTASTVAGAAVANASLFGNAAGSAVGIAQRAHVATYKVCSGGCATADILAGIGAAIRDGCDVISVSIGSDIWAPLYEEPISIASYSAASRGVFVSVSAGNAGPAPATVANEMPWALTVAASTLDRVIAATVKLGDGRQFAGESLYQEKDFGSTMWPLFYAGNSSNPDSKYCGGGTLDGLDVKGKIILCERGGDVNRIDKGKFVKDAGGAGMILMNGIADGYSTSADAHLLPASHVGFEDGDKINGYINSTADPKATILFQGTVVGSPRAPEIASFSSRGPNRASPGILKPDITGPGVNVLAAYPFHVGPDAQTQKGPAFNIESGTSMSCPHLSGIAALIKSVHPNWSPAAIKSAMMTTADVIDNKGGPILDERMIPADVFAVGAGHVDASKAHDPGLVYDTDHHHYDNYLCGLGYTDQQMTAIANKTINCSTVSNITEQELNYPSIAISLEAEGAVTIGRKVTNVGEAVERYKAEVDAPTGVSIVVKPDLLKFKKLNQRKTFNVTFTRTGGGSGYVQGQLKWVSDKHVVRSPISIKLS